jgi:outer membrane protein OmpA-like peptidoglycan-associated protein
MKRRFDAAGVGDQVTGAEGYGEKFATIDESKTDAERAPDRRISLRFTK